MNGEASNPATAAVLAVWLETGEAVTREEIAKHLKCSIATVRKYIEFGTPPRCVYDPIHRESMSRDYPGIGTGRSHKVDAWLPGRSMLREIILKK